ncbi:MAG TPA: hypothetical protein VJH03_14990 [Blastocatellia bacterium]|nr:hypothetical protein [Blastocatellia bacterium]
MKRRTPESKGSAVLSRREFAGSVAALAASAAIPQTNTATTSARSHQPPLQSAALSPAGEAQVQSILAKYGARLSDEQKAEVRRLVAQAQKATEAMAAFPLDNSNEPATAFRAYRGRRRP